MDWLCRPISDEIKKWTTRWNNSVLPFNVLLTVHAIALTSCICKTMERMVNDRLVWTLERERLISEYQCGIQTRPVNPRPLGQVWNFPSKRLHQKAACHRRVLRPFGWRKAHVRSWWCYGYKTINFLRVPYVTPPPPPPPPKKKKKKKLQ